MRILLQHRRNKFYFRRLGVWTCDEKAAFDFERTGRAIDFAQGHELCDVQLLVKFVDAEFDQIVEIPSPGREAAQLTLFWDCNTSEASQFRTLAAV